MYISPQLNNRPKLTLSLLQQLSFDSLEYLVNRSTDLELRSFRMSSTISSVLD